MCFLLVLHFARKINKCVGKTEGLRAQKKPLAVGGRLFLKVCALFAV